MGREPKTFGEYIRKWGMDKGGSQVSLAERLRVNEMTIVNWEIRGMVSRIGGIRKKLAQGIPGVGRFFVSQGSPD
jgi:transcriptional regulator with XRE-family HTH domain